MLLVQLQEKVPVVKSEDLSKKSLPTVIQNLLTKPKKNTGRSGLSGPSGRPQAPGSRLQEFEILEAGQSPSKAESLGFSDTLAVEVTRNGSKGAMRHGEGQDNRGKKDRPNTGLVIPWPSIPERGGDGPKRPAVVFDNIVRPVRDTASVNDSINAYVYRPPPTIPTEDELEDDIECQEIEETLRSFGIGADICAGIYLPLHIVGTEGL